MLIEAIPELSGVPELRRLIEVINIPSSLFRTLGCEKAYSPSDEPRFRTKLVSFVHVAFEIVEWNLDNGNYEGLFRAFEEFCGSEGKSSDNFGIEFCIGP